MKVIQQQPITASRDPKRRSYTLGNQAQTSSTAQRQIRQPDIPQQDPALRVPAPTNPAWRSTGQFHLDGQRFGARGQSVGVRNTRETNWAASGDRKPKGYNPINDGGYNPGGKRIAGDGNQPSAKAKSTYAKGRASMAKLGPGYAEAYDEVKRYGL